MSAQLRILVLLCAQSITLAVSAQLKDEHPGRTILAFPLGFYAPETNFGFGASALWNFRMQASDTITPTSQLQLTSVYTLNNQWILTLPFDLYFRQRRHALYGELTFNRFFYYFYGVGSAQPAPGREQFEERYPLIRVHYLRRLRTNWYTGARWWHEDHSILDVKEGGLLDARTIPGSGGGKAGGPGIVVLFDSRDNVYSSQSGGFAELSFHHQSRYTGSDFQFDRWRLDLRKFWKLSERHVIAAMGMWEGITGNVPFFQMSSLGSDRRLRGYYNGYFRDRGLSLTQLEYRMRLYKNFGGAVFGSLAWMSNDPLKRQLNNEIWSAGAGLRYLLNPTSRLTLRLDFAIGEHSKAAYFTVGEAF